MKEKVGYPWTTLPDYMFEHAGQGYAGHGTLCGALGVSSCLINLVIYDKDHSYGPVIDRMMWHQVGMPWCFGWQYPADGSGGDSANLLIPFLGDPNTLIPESKAFMVDIHKLASSDQIIRPGRQ